MSKYVIDTYAWIEYLEGSEQGRIVQRILFGERGEAITTAVTAAEVISVFIRRGFDMSKALDAMRRLSTLQVVEEHLAEETGVLHAEMKKKINDFGLADAFVLAAAQQLNAKVVTGDPHFAKLKNVVFLS